MAILGPQQIVDSITADEEKDIDDYEDTINTWLWAHKTELLAGTGLSVTLPARFTPRVVKFISLRIKEAGWMHTSYSGQTITVQI